MQALIGVIGFVVIFGYGIAQFVAGFIGIEHELGSVWAYIAVFLGIFLRFTIPITIGAFFGAMNVWDWHWALALIFAAPGLLIMIPGVLAALIGNFKRY